MFKFFIISNNHASLHKVDAAISPVTADSEGDDEDDAFHAASDVRTSTHKKLMWQGQSNVIVAVRVRPLNSKEYRTTENVLKVLDENVVVVLDPTRKTRKKDILRKNRSREKQYAFDFAFGAEVPTSHVYDSTTKFLIDGVVNGFNATVFAYGATGVRAVLYIVKHVELV